MEKLHGEGLWFQFKIGIGKALVEAISSDSLFPMSEQQFLARHISLAQRREIDSVYGHDGFWWRLRRWVRC